MVYLDKINLSTYYADIGECAYTIKNETSLFYVMKFSDHVRSDHMINILW